jgi:Flp pilus assembly protein TadD
MRRQFSILLLCLLLVAAVLAVYWQVWSYDFINLDDPLYVTNNRNVQAGLSRESVVWAFTTTHAANWHPLTWLSHMLDCQLYGLNPKGHHLANVFFHLLNTLLLFLVLQRMTGTLWRSGLVAALFALHPLHVESVAWVAERKDVLSTFFWMLTIWAYSRYVDRPKLARYLLTLLAFTLGLMAKPMLVTLPFVLLLLDYWPLERIQGGQLHTAASAETPLSSRLSKLSLQALRLIWEKVPFFVLAAASSVVTFLAQKSGEAIGSFDLFPLKIRLANALVSYIRYIGKMIWPQKLAVFYPHPDHILSMWQIVGAGLLLATVSLLVTKAGRRYPYLTVGWLWYLGTLVPVIGLVQVGAQAMADRYTYVPLIGLFIIIAWGGGDVVAKWRYRRIVLTVAIGTLILAVMTCTASQVKHWRNSITLFEHALEVTTDNYVAHNNLGNEMTVQGEFDEAIAHYLEALRIKPHYAGAHNNLAVVLARQGRFDQAILHYSEALRLKADSAETHNNLGVALVQLGKIDAAIAHYIRALELQPNYAEAHNNMGNALAEQGNLDDAVFHFYRALELSSGYPKAHNNLGVALARQGKFDEAISHFNEALRLQPDYTQARVNLEIAMQEKRESTETTNSSPKP